MDVGGKKPLHCAVATRAPAGNIAPGDVVREIQYAGNDGTQLAAQGDRVDLTKGVKKCEYVHGFCLFFDG